MQKTSCMATLQFMTDGFIGRHYCCSACDEGFSVNTTKQNPSSSTYFLVGHTPCWAVPISINKCTRGIK